MDRNDIKIADIIIGVGDVKEVVYLIKNNIVYTCEGNKYNIGDVIKVRSNIIKSKFVPIID